jgi:hypothetical protein
MGSRKEAPAFHFGEGAKNHDQSHNQDIRHNQKK